ncbi:MAG: class I SAM-dependent DNA methyltransferase, partial [Synergistaceae bacterium]|nr:class I SAM-dependent DNA methyltransferase [Synergistaceae bacterium]
ELNAEFENIFAASKSSARTRKLIDFQKKLGTLKFLDPACGSGNFLTETYLSLRRLENQILTELTKQQINFATGDLSPIKVKISQFFGIEINDFAVAVAKTALWIAEAQMWNETKEIVQVLDDVLPLEKFKNNIIEENALKIDWRDVVKPEELNFIMGNPPFIGARVMDATQKAELNEIFKGWKDAGNLDYVSCWYKKAADFMKENRKIKAALVSTNSICQGDSVATLWKPLFEEGIQINFAWRTFKWDSESLHKAQVYCVIVGFSFEKNSAGVIFDGENKIEAQNINAYLVDAPDVFVESRPHPLCDVPEIGIGNKPIDGGFYLFDKDEMKAFIKKEPNSKKYFREWYGADEFINSKPRYCLYLRNCPPGELRKMPECLKRVEAVKKYRLKSSSLGTVKLANYPLKFHVTNMPKGKYLVIPKVSSDKRPYIPMGFMTPDILSSDLIFIMPDATLYHFGILTSSVHMAWVRAVAGRLGVGFRYSKFIVYNNFVWPTPSEKQREKIEETAKKILEVRE